MILRYSVTAATEEIADDDAVEEEEVDPDAAVEVVPLVELLPLPLPLPAVNPTGVT